MSKTFMMHEREEMYEEGFNYYQSECKKTAIYPLVGHPLTYPVLGLLGEAGELANKVKKVFRDDDCIVTDEAKVQICAELGDILWYIAQICTELGVDMNYVALNNLVKLKERASNNALRGSGDNR